MSIQFHCQSCGKLVATPDAAAGKKGKCPYCAAVMQIPLASTATDEEPAPTPPPAPKAAPKPSAASSLPVATVASEPISFPCPECQGTVRCPGTTAGKKGRCPHCQAIVQIPLVSPPASSPPPAALKPAPKVPPTPASKPAPPKTPSAAPQAKPQAPRPQIPVAKPLEPKPPVKPKAPPTARPLAPLDPKANLDGQLAPLGDLGFAPLESTPGLAPLDDLALTPLGGAPVSDPFRGSGLAPLGGGLTPLGPDPGLQPLGGSPLHDPFAGLGPAPLGGGLTPLGGLAPYPGAAAPNPYAAPAYSPAPAIDPGWLPNSERRGLVWEYAREQSTTEFIHTCKQVLFDPDPAFRQMKLDGDSWGPLSFAIYGSLVANLTMAALGSLFWLWLLVAGASSDEGLSGEVAGFLVGQIVALVVGAVISGSLGAILGSYLSAIYFHLWLLVLGGAPAGFAATHRVVCYVSGANSALSIIPIVGLATIATGPMGMAFGLARAHGIPIWKPVIAIFGIPLICLGCCCIASGLPGVIALPFRIFG